MQRNILCSKCKKRPAMFFSSTLDGKNMEGLCLACAKNMNNPQITSMLEHMGINDENIEEVENGIAEMMENPEELFSAISEEGDGGNPFDVISK